MAKRIDFTYSGGIQYVVRILDTKEFWCVVAYTDETLDFISGILEQLGRGAPPDDDDVVAIYNQQETLYPFRLFFYVRRALIDSFTVARIYRDQCGQWISPEVLEDVEFLTDTSNSEPATEALHTLTREISRIRRSNSWKLP